MRPAQRMLSETRRQQHGVDLANDGAPVAEHRRCQRSTPPNVSDPTPAMPSSAAYGDVGRIGRIDDAVERLEVDELARAECAQDRLPAP